MRSVPSVANSSTMPSGLMPCSAHSCFQNSNPTGGRERGPSQLEPLAPRSPDSEAIALKKVTQDALAWKLSQSRTEKAGLAWIIMRNRVRKVVHGEEKRDRWGYQALECGPRDRTRDWRARRSLACSLWLPHWPSCKVMISRGIAGQTGACPPGPAGVTAERNA